MKIKYLFPFALCTLVGTTHAQIDTYTYSAGQSVKALVHPYARNGDIGRTSGMFHNYRPEFLPGGKHPGVTCQLVLSPNDHVIQPGNTEEASLICNDPIILQSKEPKYTITEGGRLVGEAVFLWPIESKKPKSTSAKHHFLGKQSIKPGPLMNSKNLLPLALSLMLCTAASHAQTSACLLKSKATIQGKTITINECIENAGAPPDTVEQACEMGFQSAKHIVKQFGGVPPVKTTLAKCPPKSVGMCKGNYGAPLNSYFYDLPAEELSEKKQNCTATGCKWH